MFRQLKKEFNIQIVMKYFEIMKISLSLWLYRKLTKSIYLELSRKWNGMRYKMDEAAEKGSAQTWTVIWDLTMLDNNI